MTRVNWREAVKNITEEGARSSHGKVRVVRITEFTSRAGARQMRERGREKVQDDNEDNSEQEQNQTPKMTSRTHTLLKN